MSKFIVLAAPDDEPTTELTTVLEVEHPEKVECDFEPDWSECRAEAVQDAEDGAFDDIIPRMEARGWTLRSVDVGTEVRY